MKHREIIQIGVSCNGLMELIAAIRQGRWPLDEFDTYDAECLEQAAQLIREDLARREKADERE